MSCEATEAVLDGRRAYAQPMFAALLVTMASVAATCHVRHATAPLAHPALECPEPVEGADALLVRGASLVFGEIHGTRQIPVAFGAIVCAAASKFDVLVGLEMPRTEQARLDSYLASDGGPAARGRLFTGPFWDGVWKDGRSSEAIGALIEQLRAWRAVGAHLHVVAFDVGITDPRQQDARERGMSEVLIAARAAHEGSALIALTGNLHARLAGGVSFAPDVTWMSQHLARAIPDLLTFDTAYGRGTAWVCTGSDPADCGEKPCGKGEDPGPTRITRDAVIDDAGHTVYSGHLHVGAVSASPPVIR